MNIVQNALEIVAEALIHPRRAWWRYLYNPREDALLALVRTDQRKFKEVVIETTPKRWEDEWGVREGNSREIYKVPTGQIAQMDYIKVVAGYE